MKKILCAFLSTIPFSLVASYIWDNYYATDWGAGVILVLGGCMFAAIDLVLEYW